MRRATTLLLLALTALLAVPAGAAADSFDDVFAAYRSSGRIDPCKFSAGTLGSARSQIPNDIEQYAPDFPDALDGALAARAKGACDPKPQPEPEPEVAAPVAPAPDDPAAPKPGAETPQPTPQAVPASAAADGAIPAAVLAAKTSDGGGPAPAALVLLAVLGALLLIGLAGWAAARWWAWEPPFLDRLRHALGEAGWRTGAAWSEFTDWVRLGR